MTFSKVLKLLIFSFFLYGCGIPDNKDSIAKFKAELFAVEKEFCAMAQSEGIQMAFHHFAADSAVALRGDQLVKGKESIRRFYGSAKKKGVRLEWSADFADVSSCGDLGYTYGKYTYTVTDSIGHSERNCGIFHTVWKRQIDGQWRFVWD